MLKIQLPRDRKFWVSSDHHLGDPRLDLMRRPFANPDEQLAAMIANHNALVSPKDIFIQLGDVCSKRTCEWLPHIAKFNGEKILVRGNHDRGVSDAEFRRYFSEIVAEGDGIEIEGFDFPCYGTHYPSLGRKDFFNLVAHIHGAWRCQLNMVNVGVDVHHFRPINADDIVFYQKAVTSVYDEDVWVAYHEVNHFHRDSRGVKSTYFSPTEQK